MDGRALSIPGAAIRRASLFAFPSEASSGTVSSSTKRRRYLLEGIPDLAEYQRNGTPPLAFWCARRSARSGPAGTRSFPTGERTPRRTTGALPTGESSGRAAAWPLPDGNGAAPDRFRPHPAGAAPGLDANGDFPAEERLCPLLQMLEPRPVALMAATRSRPGAAGRRPRPRPTRFLETARRQRGRQPPRAERAAPLAPAAAIVFPWR
jgi:hypothetical protein